MGLTRAEMWSRIGLTRTIDPLVTNAYSFVDWLEAQEIERGHGREHPWHVSFHGSSFPGDDPNACGRLQLYRMLDAPRDEKWYPGRSNRRGRMFMENGKDHETRLVEKWHRAGMLLSAPPWERQTEYEDSDAWLTCTLDAIVLPLDSDEPHVSEEKMKSAEVIEQMRRLIRGPDKSHVNQVRCQIGFANEAGPQTVLRCYNTGRLAIRSLLHGDLPGRQQIIEFDPICPEHGHDRCLHEVTLKPVRSGYLYYSSRDDTDKTWEFYFDHNPAFMAAGRRQLKQWQEAFLTDQLPQTNFKDKRFSHPFEGWTWTRSKKMPNSPCQWCDFGQICRDDHKLAVQRQGHIRLSESAAIEDAQDVKPDYTFDDVRRAVLARWGLEDQQAKAA